MRTSPSALRATYRRFQRQIVRHDENRHRLCERWWEVSRSLASDEPLEIGIKREVQRQAGTRESYLTKLRPDLVQMRLQWNPQVDLYR